MKKKTNTLQKLFEICNRASREEMAANATNGMSPTQPAMESDVWRST